MVTATSPKARLHDRGVSQNWGVSFRGVFVVRIKLPPLP